MNQQKPKKKPEFYFKPVNYCYKIYRFLKVILYVIKIAILYLIGLGNLTITRANKEEYEKYFYEWQKMDDWIPTKYDKYLYHDQQPDGFIMLREKGIPMLLLSAVYHTPDMGFLGSFIASPDARGYGYGMFVSLWLLIKYGRYKNVKTYACVADHRMALKYQQTFKIKIKKFYGRYYLKKNLPFQEDKRVRRANVQDLQKILEYDLQVWGYDRSISITHLVSIPEIKVFIFEEITQIGYQLQGYGAIRDGQNPKDEIVHRIAPLMAENSQIACRLLDYMCLGVKEDIVIDLDENIQDSQMIKEKYCDKLDTLHSLQSKGTFRCQFDKIFGFYSIETG